MLRGLVDEVVRRRMWPFLLVAVLVAIAAPLLFMKSTPAGAPSASSSPPAAAPGKLPAPAQKLVTASDKAATPRQHASRTGKDPFAPPASAEKAAAAATAAAAQPTKPKAAKKANKAAKQKAVPVVITNSDGSTIKVANHGKAATPTTSNSSASTADTQYVDVRFAERAGGKVRDRITRLRTFDVDGKIVAVFMKWSPKRKKAVFAIDPTTIVTGPVACRRKEGVCRYVDIPAGSYARLTWLGANGSFVTRRLDVVKIHVG